MAYLYNESGRTSTTETSTNIINSSSSEESEEEEDDSPSRDDVCFGDEAHFGTKQWRKAVRFVASKNDEPYSPSIYRLIKKRLSKYMLIVECDESLFQALMLPNSHTSRHISSHQKLFLLADVRFFDRDKNGKWKEVSKKDLVKNFGNAYEAAQKERLDESFTETTAADHDDLAASSPRRSRGSSSKRKPRSSSPGIITSVGGSPNINDEPMMKTVSMYFPPPDSRKLPDVSEELTPLNKCSEETVTALTAGVGTTNNVTSSQGGAASTAITATSSSGVVGMSNSTASPVGSSSTSPQFSPSAFGRSATDAVSTAVTTSTSGVAGMSGGIVPPGHDQLYQSMYGRSIFQVPNSHNRLVAEAEFENFAPKTCICCQQCVGDQQRARTFARVYENRLEVNTPWAPWCCWTPEYCITDQVQVHYFDNGPSQAFCGDRAELDCLAEVCGHPVVFVQVPRCCCNLVDLRPCYGERAYAAPCTCCELRWPWICIGKPCYECFACPFIHSLKNGKEFMAKYRGAVDTYAKTRPIKRHTRFHRVSEKPCGCDKVTILDPYPMEHSMFQHAMKLKNIPEAIPNAFIMDRA